MAPKRKRADEPTTKAASKATRSSTRNKTIEDDLESVSTAAMSVDDVAVPEDPPAKKTKKASAKTARAPKAGSSKGKAKEHTNEAAAAGVITNSNSASLDSATAKAKSTSSGNTDLEPYTPARATALFTTYADEDDPATIGPEGFERLCSDAEVPLDGAKPLILAWLLRASEMARISKTEWEAGMAELQIGSVSALAMALNDFDDLLLSDKPPQPHASPAKGKKPTPEPYNKSRYHQAAKDRRKAFNELYMFCFNLAKPPQARLTDIETGTAFWSVLLAPQYPIVNEVLAFVAEKGTYKGVNKDLWQMMLEFCRTVSPTLEGYDPEGAWPTMIDEFVAWKKDKLAAA